MAFGFCNLIKLTVQITRILGLYLYLFGYLLCNTVIAAQYRCDPALSLPGITVV